MTVPRKLVSRIMIDQPVITSFSINALIIKVFIVYIFTYGYLFIYNHVTAISYGVKLMTKTSVYIRSLRMKKIIDITSDSKPEVSPDIKKKWQTMINLTAEVLKVPAGLIMRITTTDMEIFLKSTNTANPYPDGGKDTLGHGLYCETVIGTNHSLTVEDALKDPVWKDNPDIILHMISYYGLPLNWPDNEVFGTICLLDDKANRFGGKYTEWMVLFKEIIETDLKLLFLNSHLEYLNNIDDMTGVASRKHVFEVIEANIIKYRRNMEPFTIAMIDLNRFKAVNDRHGHKIGDEVLKRFAKFMRKKMDQDIFFGRYGGDEFIMLLPNRKLVESEQILDNLKQQMLQDTFLSTYEVSFSYGCVEIEDESDDAVDFIDKADQKMYAYKNNKNIKS